ncbi:hypothetical protein MWU75_05900 [Ornithinimicrobium sp. F0845]|uniref:hypothetical protein n=1 Tax=Ornithinimicrobium sp. F0845 TaxID=2926412 RepID=UPI001FF4D50C|nr:hypothetical protein [Ornithinimicrobium sp. F0845]MCK0111667.1 hypothetical protein [Ornithinimicrobium sp. F0845]
MELHPSGYPWSEPVRTGLLGDRGFDQGSPGDLDGRVPVVAVGSNASPVVLAGKLARLLGPGLPVAAAEVHGLAVGHSAHISARGYVAAAPVQGDGVRSLTVCWFDEAQLATLDATEPNYRRVQLPGSMPCLVAGAPLTGAEVYESVHGVLGEDGTPLELLDQAGVLAWLTERLPALGGLDHDRLVDEDLREQVRRALLEAELVLPSGL